MSGFNPLTVASYCHVPAGAECSTFAPALDPPSAASRRTVIFSAGTVTTAAPAFNPTLTSGVIGVRVRHTTVTVVGVAICKAQFTKVLPYYGFKMSMVGGVHQLVSTAIVLDNEQ